MAYRYSYTREFPKVSSTYDLQHERSIRTAKKQRVAPPSDDATHKASLNPNCLKRDYSAASSPFLRMARLRVFFSGACTVVSFTPANSGSIMMRPQYSHTMIFLRILMSS